MEKINGNRSVTSLRGGLRARAQGSLGLVLHVNKRSTAFTERHVIDLPLKCKAYLYVL